MKNYFFIVAFIVCSHLSFSQKAVVAVEDMTGMWGYATPDGTEIVPTKYIDAHAFTTDGVAMVRMVDKKWALINSNNEKVSNALTNYEPKGYVFYTKGFDEEMMLVVSSGKYGYLNGKGEVIIKPEFEELSEYKGDYAIGKIDAKYYIVDRAGVKTEIKATADHVNYLTNGYAPFRWKKQFGYVDVSGKVVIEATYKKVGYFEGERAWAMNASGKLGIIDTKGNWLVEAKYDKISDPEPTHHVAIGKIGELVEFIEADGSTTIMEGVVAFGDFSEGFAWVRQGELVGVVNHKGDWIIPAEYTKIERATSGFVNVKKGELWGLFDVHGKQLLPFDYERIENLNDGLIAVKKAGLWGFSNAAGDIVIEPKFDNVRDFHNGYAAASKGGLWGMINKTGEFTMKPKYHRVNDVVLTK
ncbi:MAG: hypothetical protein A3D92_14730 [Bacteroidetes bacterium RIFCSPHIGHO2_02_FULL_44_7]|nr:MAG: hypothetical protein A3D92_14730 [Bacteroidetes bacterium RIFCSPHIGHO2_02_FULL_44_7]